MKVLIVDDERAIGKVLKTAFENRGYEALWVEDAENILSVVEEFKPDVILLDINMPGKSGFEALKEIRDAGYKTPVVMVSVLSQDFNIEKAYNLGAVDYVVKPVSINYLIRKVEQLAKGN